MLNKPFLSPEIKRQSSASLAFVRGLRRWPVDSPHKGPVTRKYFHLMTSSCIIVYHVLNLTLQWLPLHVHSSYQARATYMMVSMQAINSCHYRAFSNTSRRDDMMTSSNGNIFRVTGHLCAEFTPVNSPHKGQWRGALIFTLICARINGRLNNREAGDLRRHRAHYDEIVMKWLQIGSNDNLVPLGDKLLPEPMLGMIFFKCIS